MKILVTVKRVESTESKIKVKPDGSGIATEGMKYEINPFDLIALEEALRLRDKHTGEVVVLLIGPPEAQTELRSPALAMGADRAIHVKHTGPMDSDGAARVIAKIVESEKPDLVLCGKQAVDDDQGQAPQILAELLGWPQATAVSKHESLESPEEKSKTPGIQVTGASVKVLREVDGGIETLEMPLPAVLSCELRLNLPRFASLPNIMKARKKEVKELTPQELGVDVTPKVSVLKYAAPPARKGGIKVPDVATLVDKLRNEAKVI